MEGVARNFLKCKKILFPKQLQVANKNCYNNIYFSNATLGNFIARD